MTVFTLSVYHSSNFNSCSERLCEGIGQTLRKDDSCDRTLAIYIQLFTRIYMVYPLTLCQLSALHLYVECLVLIAVYTQKPNPGMGNQGFSPHRTWAWFYTAKSLNISTALLVSGLEFQTKGNSQILQHKRK